LSASSYRFTLNNRAWNFLSLVFLLTFRQGVFRSTKTFEYRRLRHVQPRPPFLQPRQRYLHHHYRCYCRKFHHHRSHRIAWVNLLILNKGHCDDPLLEHGFTASADSSNTHSPSNCGRTDPKQAFQVQGKRQRCDFRYHKDSQG
jgi:hypothetical protein